MVENRDSMVGELDIAWTQALSGLQKLFGASHGTIGEIGVHYGAYFAALVALSWPGEPLWVCDLFDELQNLNLDKSGRGNVDRFVRKVSDHTGREDIHMEIRPSYELYKHNIAPSKPFRMLSIDGSHMETNTFTDLSWATRHIASGGLVAIDDVASPRWLGPSRALRAFWHLHDRQYLFLPLLLTPKKLWIVGRRWHANYSDGIARLSRHTTSGKTLTKVGTFHNFVSLLNTNEPRVNGTVDHAPLWLPTPTPSPHVWFIRSLNHINTAAARRAAAIATAESTFQKDIDSIKRARSKEHTPQV
tara:strand:+ start:1764 stop:2672 length:909 start_codon:yes stop_codon:yes gene_type:complete